MANIGEALQLKELKTVKFGICDKDPQAQTSGAGQAALSARVDGAHGCDTEAHFKEIYDLVVEIRAALVANGIIKGSA